MEQKSQVLITVSGPDHPGITATLVEHIIKSGDEISDMGQAVTHGLLSLSILLDLKNVEPGLERSAPILKELLFQCNQMGLNLEYRVITKPVDLPMTSGEEFILNCVSVDKIPPQFIYAVAKTLADNNINILRIDNVTPKNFTSLEINTMLPQDVDIPKVKQELLQISTCYQVDVALLKDNVYRRSKRLIAFDMDSTLIQIEVIDEMAKLCGVGEKVQQITHQAMNGMINFDTSLTKRVSLLKGMPVERLKTILDTLPLTPGVEEFIKTVKRLGYKVALISGGFSYFADALKDRLGLDYAFANELEIRDGKLTGNVVGQIINAEQKAMVLKLITQQERISLEQVVAIGDGANDLPMLSTAGLGIAFHAKEIVKKQAQQHMSFGPMTSILYFLGIPGPTNE